MNKSAIILITASWLAATAGRAQEPAGPEGQIAHHLVTIQEVYPHLLPEVRYATTYNFTGTTLYPFPAVYVHRDLVEALRRVQSELADKGYGLKIFDGYRPLSVQKKMWDLIRDERYVSDPSKSQGKHTRGTAVDVTLVNHLGNELLMPTDYDDFTEKAHRNSLNWSTEAKRNSQMLEAVMVKHGFVPFPFEWWHFDFKGWESYPPLDISFEDLSKGVSTTTPVP